MMKATIAEVKGPTASPCWPVIFPTSIGVRK
jgi:hypothetical protein